MRCPKCDNKSTRVVDSRDTNDHRAIRRRRLCEKCNYRFTTFEQPESIHFIVIKKDESREPYQREKVEKGLWKACEKRPVKQEQIDRVIQELEEEWQKIGKEVPSKKIGEGIMKKLKKLDEVAYIRFASVYRQFKDLDTFKKELQKLIDN